MGWGIWKKIKQGISKAVNFVKDKVVKPVYNGVIKPVFNGVKDLLPAIGGAVGAAKGNPQAGIAIGNLMKNVGENVIK